MNIQLELHNPCFLFTRLTENRQIPLKVKRMMLENINKMYFQLHK